MRRDFEIKDGIYLAQAPHELDLHNNFDFCGLHYSAGLSRCIGGAPQVIGLLRAHQPR